MKAKWKKTGGIMLAAVVVLGALAATSFYRVGQGEEALVLTFGRVTDTRGPGLYWKIPLIQSVIPKALTTIHTKEYGTAPRARDRRARRPLMPMSRTKA